jgi:hypothetical protein
VTIPLVDLITNYLVNTKAFKIWGKLHANQQSLHIPISMDSYAKLDFVFLDFVYSLGLTPCQKCQHNHHVPCVKVAGCSSLKTYGIYHLHGTLTNQ